MTETIYTLAEKLGLQNPDEHELDKYVRNANMIKDEFNGRFDNDMGLCREYLHRQTGKTTRMLLEVLVVLLNTDERVGITANKLSHQRDLQDTLFDFLYRLGKKPEHFKTRCLFVHDSCYKNLRGVNCRLFFDDFGI